MLFSLLFSFTGLYEPPRQRPQGIKMQLASFTKTIWFVPGVFSYILFLYPALWHNLIFLSSLPCFPTVLTKNHPTKTPHRKASFLPQDAFEISFLLSGSLSFLLSVLCYTLILTVWESAHDFYQCQSLKTVFHIVLISLHIFLLKLSSTTSLKYCFPVLCRTNKEIHKHWYIVNFMNIFTQTNLLLVYFYATLYFFIYCSKLRGIWIPHGIKIGLSIL